jgi:hypothetical protein
MKALSGKTDMYNLVPCSTPYNSVSSILHDYIRERERLGFHFLDPYRLWRGTEVILDEFY